MITLKLAGIPIGVDNRYPYIEKLARDYVTHETAEFVVAATDEDIEEERTNSEFEFSPGYLESIVVYRKIAERLPSYDAFVFHGAVLAMGGRAYAFTAKSGVGKTTHTRLWLSTFGDEVHYLNGDKPVIRFINGEPIAFGTPYRGKEGYGVNESLPLESIALISRGEKDSAAPVSGDDAVIRLASQVYMPKDPVSAVQTLSLIDKLSSAVKLVELHCTMDRNAALVARRAMEK